MRILLSGCTISLVAWAGFQVVMGKAWQGFLNTAADNIKLLALLGVCFSMLKITEHLEASAELGCFIAGLMLKIAQGHYGKGSHGSPGTASQLHEGGHAWASVIHVIEPVKDFFLAIFFASVGMHLYPTFLWDNIMLLVTLTGTTVLLKYTVTLAVRGSVQNV
eukprot:m.152656 g.152656  ORF g.152656 m.152656 type:complete len:163 (-) comp17444_c0_seq2:50-538(-)